MPFPQNINARHIFQLKKPHDTKVVKIILLSIKTIISQKFPQSVKLNKQAHKKYFPSSCSSVLTYIRDNTQILALITAKIKPEF